MENNNGSGQEENKFAFNLSNAAQLASFAIALGIVFSVIRNYIYYVLLLHVPIFQYLNLSDVVLITPSGLFWALYFSSIETANFISKSDKFSSIEKPFYAILLYAFAGLLTWLGFYNDPVIEQGLKAILQHWWYLIPFVIYIVVRVVAINKQSDFFKRNRYIGACILCIWYALFDSYASYTVLTKPSRHIHFVMKMKTGKKIVVDQKNIYAGRTNTHWFFYNSKTEFVRTVKNDDVDIIDFDSITK